MRALLVVTAWIVLACACITVLAGASDSNSGVIVSAGISGILFSFVLFGLAAIIDRLEVAKGTLGSIQRDVNILKEAAESREKERLLAAGADLE